MQNGIPDTSTTYTPPVIDRQELVVEKKIQRYLKSEEWRLIKEYMESRKAFYQTYLPDGTNIHDTSLTMEERGIRWSIANSIIAEFDALIDSFEVQAKNEG